MTTQEKAARRKAALARCREIIDAAKKDQRGLSAKESGEFDQLQREAKTIHEELERAHDKEQNGGDGKTERERWLEETERQGTPASQRGGVGAGIKLSKEERERATSRLLMAVAFSRGRKDAALGYAQRMFGSDDVVTKAIERDLHQPDFAIGRRVSGDRDEQRALASNDGPSGGFAVADEWSQDIIEFLRPASVVSKMNPVTLPMTTGTLRLPRISGGAVASYVGENANLSKTQPTFGQVVLNFKKLGAVLPISNDFLRYVSPQGETMVRQDLQGAMAQRADLAFIRDNGTANTITGMRYWAAAASGGVINAQTGQALATVIADLGKLVVQLRNNNVRFLQPGWLFAPRIWNFLLTVTNTNGFYVFRDEMLSKGTLWGYPFQVTTQIPTNLSDVSAGTAGSEVYLADFADVVIGQATQLLVDSSTEAAYYDGANVQAAFSLDQMVIRAIIEHDLVMRHDFSVAVLTGMTWS
jgi:HK97 family phage major capsid protein